MSSLKPKTLHGLFWSFIDSFGSYFIRFNFGVAISRALGREDYLNKKIMNSIFLTK